MAVDIDALIEEAVVHGEIAAGTSPRWLARQHDPRFVLAMSGQRAAPAKPPVWRKEEDDYLRCHYLFQSDAELAAHLGRTPEAVHLRISRDLRLPSRSKMSDWPTVREVARRLGVPESRTIRHWGRLGLIEIYPLPLEASQRVIYWPRMVRFAVNPMNWVYFDISRVTDPHLRRLLERQKARWNDEWWTTGQAAAYHGVESQDIQRNILAGKIKGVHWGNWRVLRSEVTRPGLHFPKGKGSGRSIVWSPEGDAFLVLGKALGLSYRVLSEMAGLGYAQCANHRLLEMQKHGLIAPTIQRHNLAVLYNPDTGALLADWRDEAHRRRFKRLAVACERFQQGAPLSRVQRAMVVGTVVAWANYHAVTEEQRAEARRFLHWTDLTKEAKLREAWGELRGWGIEPFGEKP